MACGAFADGSARPATAQAKPACNDTIPVFRGGSQEGTICASDAAAEGLTVVDLSETWTPRVLDDPRDPYHDVYLALASERFDDLPDDVEPERFVEVYGIPPTFGVLRHRISDDARFACHEAIDDAALDALDHTIRPSDRRPLDPGERDAVLAAQLHLRCDGLLGESAQPGVLDGATAHGLFAWQRRDLVLTSRGALDGPTRRSLMRDLRDADFLGVLRVLRERVADAAGLLEDGSARLEPGEILGRRVDPPAYLAGGGRLPDPSGAPDLIAVATEAAAEAIGWTSPDAFLEGIPGRTGLVAVPLPPPPRYHAPEMELRAVIDRGDVVYDLHDAPPVQRRPVLTIYAKDGGRDIALARWVTTIGGWSEEVDDRTGRLGLRYKESPVGPSQWTELWSAPSWLPPQTTPDDHLLRRAGGRWLPREDLVGPGHHSAYGLAMLVHESPSDGGALVDEGIRTHGSVSYRSILHGTSHGCHRLHNQFAMRLAGFLLAHRRHHARGPQGLSYERTLRHAGTSRVLRVDTRGTLFTLDPPVPVEVLEGRILGAHREAPEALMPLR